MSSDAGIAQLVEQLIRNQQVGGSNPLPGSIIINCQSSDYFLYSNLCNFCQR